MTSRERISMALNHQEPDRVPIQDGPWATAVTRWETEGLDADPASYFGYEMISQGSDTSLQLPSETVEETNEYTVVKNANGALIRNWKHQTSTPEMIDFTIKDRKTWEEYKPRMVYNESRVDWNNGLKHNQKIRQGDKYLSFSGVLGYDKTQGIVGSETLLMAMLDDPDWVADMFMTGVEVMIQTAEEMMAGGYVFDGVFLFDDMGYRNGTLFSPADYRELLFPAHKRACDFFKSKNFPIILHSCGCVQAFIPDLIEAGFTCLQPLEVKAGMDVIELKKDFGHQLAFMGGIDVRKMAHPDPSTIEEEIRTKVSIAKVGGGYIYHSDHSVPDNVSFQQYCRVIELVQQYGKYE